MLLKVLILLSKAVMIIVQVSLIFILNYSNILDFKMRTFCWSWVDIFCLPLLFENTDFHGIQINFFIPFKINDCPIFYVPL